jgi:hypothetical protein
MQRRQHELLVEALQHFRNAGRQVVVEQDGAGVEIRPARAGGLAVRTSGSSSSVCRSAARSVVGSVISGSSCRGAH